jgi:hypothetical protein
LEFGIVETYFLKIPYKAFGKQHLILFIMELGLLSISFFFQEQSAVKVAHVKEKNVKPQKSCGHEWPK